MFSVTMTVATATVQQQEKNIPQMSGVLASVLSLTHII
jgi:hypothetical protein